MCGHMSAHQQALYSSYSPSILVPFSLLVFLCKGFSVHKYMMVRANPTHSTKSLTFWTRLCLNLCMRVMRGYYGGKGGGGGGVAMPSQYCCVFASLLLLRHARTMLWCHFIFGLWYFRIFSMLVWSFDHFVFAFHRLWRKAAGQTANLQGLDQRWRRLVSARQGYPGYCTKVAKGCQWFNGWLANSILKSRKHLCYLPIECHDVHGVRRWVSLRPGKVPETSNCASAC